MPEENKVTHTSFLTYLDRKRRIYVLSYIIYYLSHKHEKNPKKIF